MFKKLYNKWFNKPKVKTESRHDTLKKLNGVLYPDGDINVVEEEITTYKIKGEDFNLGDKVICRSNECDPLMVGVIVEFWNNDGKWDNCIPQVEVGGQVWGIMGHIKHYSEELMETLKPMRALEQWNHLIPEQLKEMYSYSEEQMIKKEKQYKRVQKNKTKTREKVN